MGYQVRRRCRRLGILKTEFTEAKIFTMLAARKFNFFSFTCCFCFFLSSSLKSLRASTNTGIYIYIQYTFTVKVAGNLHVEESSPKYHSDRRGAAKQSIFLFTISSLFFFMFTAPTIHGTMEFIEGVTAKKQRKI